MTCAQTFKEEHYCAFFKFLTTTPLLADVPLDGVHITEKSRKQASDYLDSNDFMPSWVSENYSKLQPQESGKHRTFVSIKDLYAGFQDSDKFEYLTKQEKRTYNEAKFREAIKKSNAYKSHYRATKTVKIPLAFKGYNTKDGLVDIEKINES